jgi:hypothetical protein
MAASSAGEPSASKRGQSPSACVPAPCVLGARARPHELGAAPESAAHRPDAFVRCPDAVEFARPQQLGQRSHVEAVGLRAGLTGAGVARRDDDHPRDVRLDDPRDLPRVAGDPSATQSRGSRLWSNSSSASGRTAIRPAERTRPSATIATSQKSRWTSSATALTCPSFDVDNDVGEPVGKRHRRIRARSATGQVAGAANEKPGSTAHRPKTACPTCVLPKGPLVPVSRT